MLHPYKSEYINFGIAPLQIQQEVQDSTLLLYTFYSDIINQLVVKGNLWSLSTVYLRHENNNEVS